MLHNGLNLKGYYARHRIIHWILNLLTEIKRQNIVLFKSSQKNSKS